MIYMRNAFDAAQVMDAARIKSITQGDLYSKS
jgi:hypothetical protein